MQSPNIRIYGTYTHANFSYNARNSDDAVAALVKELVEVDKGARTLLGSTETAQRDRFVDGQPRLAIGATPTAHAAAANWQSALRMAGVNVEDLIGKVELCVRALACIPPELKLPMQACWKLLLTRPTADCNRSHRK